MGFNKLAFILYRTHVNQLYNCHKKSILWGDAFFVSNELFIQFSLSFELSKDHPQPVNHSCQ